ncbi:hypothetical protein RR46_08972 [Papilio xuthus]|uniref:Uncharacterized protein n=1 Tax=Papilio xuthus TaxID=66420 RepID=A0A194PRD0_PAPXU|nr:hypothetical protein RR46_08972 [Papilio xuthus]
MTDGMCAGALAPGNISEHGPLSDVLIYLRNGLGSNQPLFLRHIGVNPINTFQCNQIKLLRLFDVKNNLNRASGRCWESCDKVTSKVAVPSNLNRHDIMVFGKYSIHAEVFVSNIVVAMIDDATTQRQLII